MHWLPVHLDRQVGEPPVSISNFAKQCSDLDALNKQRAQQQFCDVALVVDCKTFHAHKCILVASCPKFKEILLSQPK
jgi:hypothetical protein